MVDAMDDGELFGELLLHHRTAAGLSQAAVSRRSGLSERALRDLERGGTKRPRRHTVAALAEILGLTGVDLVAFTAAAQGQTVVRPESLASSRPHTTGDLVGRERQLAILADLVGGGRHRIITVLGPAGVGKTRLVAEFVATLGAGVARDPAESPLEVYMVELTAVSDPALLGERIAEAVGAVGSSKLAAEDRVAAKLRGRRVLLVLDCFERLTAGASAVSSLVRRCRGLTVVVTSQRPLRVSGEREMRLAPLPAATAAELFVRRAAAANPGWSVADVDTGAVAEICRRLDGLPLAIELAAARMRVLSARELASRLDRRLQMLTGGPVDLPPRHRSLRGAIESSLELVEPPTRRVFAWLGAFPGGVRLADLEAVTATLGGSADLCLAAIEELVQTSLVRVVDDAGMSRYTLPDAVRELAVEELTAAVDGDGVRGAMAALYLSRLAAGLDDPEPQRAIAGPEADNLRAAVDTAIRDRPTLLTPSALDALYRHYDLTGRYREGQSAFHRAGMAGLGLGFVRAGRMALLRRDVTTATQLGESALASLADDDHAGLAETRLFLGAVAIEIRDWRQARAHLRAAMVQARSAGAVGLLGRALNNLGVVSAYRGRLRDAERQTLAALTAKRRSGAGPIELARTLTNLAENARDSGSPALAARRAAEAASLFAAAGHHRAAAIAESTTALAWLSDGDLDAAETAMRRAGELLGEPGDDQRTATLVNLRRTLVWHAAGRSGEAARLLQQTLPIAMRHDHRTREEAAFILVGHAARIAIIAPALAASLLGGAAQMLSVAKRGLPPSEQDAADEAKRVCRTALGEAGFTTAWAAGAEAEPETLAAMCGRIPDATA